MTTAPIATGTPPADGPLVVACLRIADLHPEVHPLTGVVSRDPWGVGLSAADAAALEYALRMAEAWSGRVLAISAGPAAIEPVLRGVMAVGASVVRIADEVAGTEHGYTAELAGDEEGLARDIADALARLGPPDLVLCGDRSVDRGTGALPAFLAHQLGAAQALGLVTIEAEGPSDHRPATGGHRRSLIGERRLDGGWRERLRVPLPAVCSVEAAGTRLRRASLAGALAAEATAVPVDQPTGRAAPGPEEGAGSTRIGATRPFTPRTRVVPAPDSADPRTRLLALTGALVAHDPPVVVGPVGPTEAADELIGFLVRHGYLEPPASPPPVGTAGGG
ncbi:MAG TPA: mycofactocin-associated electron transfer flavoprotein beta subunit [Acidimicrobiales bacterium]|nr:mycofactocin-associated electron transfer flavoprotein beta subunit [Acidimicrobiales bacterium]